MAVRARRDNLELDHPAAAGADATLVDFAELWEHRGRLQAVCRRMVGDDGTADDVVQDTYLRALTAEGLERRFSFGPWLATVARRRAIDELRAGARLSTVATPPERCTDVADDPLDQLLRQERVSRVRVALATLAPRERRLLLRQIAHGLSLAELASEEATSVASVRSVLSRARTKLRSSLERGGPLGAAPLPRLVAAVKRRLQQWGARLEGNAPMLTGAGAQLGDVVAAAVIAAAALLLAGSAPAEAPSTAVSLVATEQPTELGRPASPPSDRGERRAEPGERPDRAGGRSERSEDEPASAERPVLQPPGVDLPGLPVEGADQPEEVFVEHVAASEDGRTLVISGNKDAGAGANAGQALYRSDDGGHSWRWLEAGGYASGYAVIPRGFAQHGTLFVAAGPVLQRSDDGGRNFRPVSKVRGSAVALPAAAGDRRIFLAPAGLGAYDAATDSTTLYQSLPSGTSIGDMAVLDQTAGPRFVVSTSFYATTGAVQGYVQRCTPTDCTPPVALPHVFTAPKLLVSRATPGLVLAWGSQRLYRSVDGGATFAEVPMPGAKTLHTVVEGAPGELLLARANTGNASSSGLLRSVDGGLTWTPLAVGTPLQQGAEGLAYLSSGRIVAGIDGKPGFRCSVDGGLTWTSRCPL
ncbi:MAG TPA: sigma-70 family RNA polymerase sigma factor [Acidimicrobiales bacterium]|nr:sigma-70 family RNA polymerase sigma factor [Acidimicrobiales bacterium]